MSGKRWIDETLHGGIRFAFEADRILYESDTEHQHLVLFENSRFGRVLMLDGATQVTTRDEFVYHEMMAHVPILAHGRARRILVIGGGDGGIAREALKHASVERLVEVEIDRAVVDFSLEHLPEVSGGAYEDPRLDLVIADGMDYVAGAGDAFDVIIVDSTDPQGPGAVLFSERFYRAAQARLAEGGVIVTQNGVPFLQPDELVSTMTCFGRLFADAGCYLAVIPTYIGGFMAMGWGTDDANLRAVPLEMLEARFRAARLETLYYTPAVHKAAFALPRFIADRVEAGLAAARRGG
ncbi:MAG: polyamine aminopropyltransferase [Pseudomonadota bacterium]|nr:polyamine aminopropyltransferase [Pseudomonadota bacterium]